MQSLQQHRDGEGRAQGSTPSFPPLISSPDMAGQPFPPYPYQERPPVVVQNFYQAPPVASPVMVDVQHSGPGWLSRALWFIFIGWWLGLIWLHIGYALCLTGIFLPVGLLMLNRLPAVLTLRSSDQQTTVAVYGNGMTVVRTGEPQQVDFLLRAVYFLVVGWWLGYVWALVGYVLCFTLVLMPVGVMMLNRLPTVLTLRRV
jgi:uncharacterized membrane protein YccF (DUF307 family)